MVVMSSVWTIFTAAQRIMLDLMHNPHLPKDDPKRRQPDIFVVKQGLGWEPQIKLEAGLKKIIAYFRKLL